MRVQITEKMKEYVAYCSSKRNAVRIYAEGDSWFDYLGSDILTEVHDQAAVKPVILKRANGGDEAGEMLSGSQRHQLVKDMVEMKQFHHGQYGIVPDVILFSAGGNDLVGMYDFPMFVKKAPDGSPVEEFINEFHLSARLQQIALSYIELGLIRDRYFPGTPIVTHQYDWPIPSNKGVTMGPFEVLKAWMKPYMDGMEIAFEDQKQIVRYVLGKLGDMQDQLQQGTFVLKGDQCAQISNFHIARTRDQIAENEWANEIHPNAAGFEKVGAVVLETIRGVAPGLNARI